MTSPQAKTKQGFTLQRQEQVIKQLWDLRKIVIVQFYATFYILMFYYRSATWELWFNLQGDQVQLAPSRQQVLALEPQKAFNFSL